MKRMRWKYYFLLGLTEVPEDCRASDTVENRKNLINLIGGIVKEYKYIHHIDDLFPEIEIVSSVQMDMQQVLEQIYYQSSRN